VGRRPLELPPPIEVRLEGKEASVASAELDPVNLRLTCLQGCPTNLSSAGLEDPELDRSRYLAAFGPLLEASTRSTFLYRVDGLGSVPVSLSLLDLQGRALQPSVQRQSAAALGYPGQYSVGLKSVAVPLDRVGVVRVQLGSQATNSFRTGEAGRAVR
jgi:hypothetical protein